MIDIRRFVLVFGAFVCCLQSAIAGTLADTPLSLKGAVPPNVMFALSVEFPTANTAAYQDSNGYSVNNQYLGYFDKDKCYAYDTGNGWFYPLSVTTTRACSGGWSGNFLNWATMTGLDEFRFAMTGGNRYQDTATLTVLERTYQSGQGGTGNFTDKTFTDTSGTATPFPAGTAITIQNQGRGVQMVVSPAGSTGVVTCTTPSLTGGTPPFTCTLTLQGTTDTSACSTWTGTGSAASPYTCTSFAGFSGLVPTTSTAVTPAAQISSGGTAATVTCSGPFLTGSTFNCTSIALGNGHTSTCTNWTGSGTSASPYVCTAFSTFSGGEVFAANGAPTTSTFSSSTPGAQVQDPGSSGRIQCTVTASGSTVTTDCPLNLVPGDTASCTTYSGAGTNANPYVCNGFGFSGGETYVSSSNSTSSLVTANGKIYASRYRITYNLPPTVTTKYYASSYPGTTGGSTYYYTASYNVGFSTSLTYNVRVKVCDSSVALESNCKQYGSSWKPTGVLQDNGDKMRFGVTSYFQANDVDNAVLRSKAKYIAPQKYASSGGLIANPVTEWNSADGTLIRNPDATDAATLNSFVGTVADTGVINYINKFGSVSHSYKTYDVVGKLYYETLKYLRHMSPTAAFYQGARTSNSDGFPVINQWDDPVLYSCQKNYIITMGDTHTWCDKRLPGDTHTAANNGTCNAYTDGNGNAHVADFGSLPGDTGVNVATETNYVGGLEGLGNIATSYTGAGSSAGYGMAGLASWAARNDIRPSAGDFVGKQTVSTFVIDVDEYRDCGYRSQYWLAAKFGDPSFYDSNGNWLTVNNPWNSTPTLPAGACASNAPPGYNAAGGAVTAWPKNLLRAGDPLSMIASVKSAIATIVAQISDEAALAQSSGNLDTGTGAYIYQAIFNTGGWTGEVQALPIDQTGGVSTVPAWRASTLLPAHGSRNILTFNDNTRTGVLFDPASFATNLSSAQQALLNANEFGTADGLGADRMRYIRGDQSKEANIYSNGTASPNPNPNYGWRSRTGLLGDVINSNPLFVGPPASGYSGAAYKAFATTYASRTPVLYVGGNDGMLHGYNASYTYSPTTGMPVTTASSGVEIMGYVPSAVYKNLSQLMAPNYSHKYFVDGAPIAADACFSTCSSAADWKTVLIGGLNAGGQGIYALDVTDPGSFTASKVLWEFTEADDRDLGYTFGKPLVRKLNDGKWYVIFGSGYNNSQSDSSASSTGRAYLFVLLIDGPGSGQPWALNTNYYKIELKSPSEPASPTLPLNPPNGLAFVSALDKTFDGKVDYVYGGDRNGNIWKFDLTSSTPANWKVAFGTVASPLPLFTATNAAATYTQQITTGLELVSHPSGGFMLLFGTGAWIDTTDPLSPFRTDSFYGIWDKDDGTTRVTSRSDLQQQTVIASIDANGAACTYGSGNCYNVYSSCEPNYSASAQPSNVNSPLCPATIAYPNGTGQQLGWVFDLPGNGERTRSTFPKLNGPVAKFTTLTPSTDPCTGNTLGMEHNITALTGAAPAAPLYLIPGASSNLITLQSGAIPGYTGPAIAVAPSGKALAGGASDNPVSFSAKKTGAGTSAAVTPCVGEACTALGNLYIPGWGFLTNQSPMWLHCGAGTTNTAVDCSWEMKQGKYGRVNWKQILR